MLNSLTSAAFERKKLFHRRFTRFDLLLVLAELVVESFHADPQLLGGIGFIALSCF